MKRAEKHPKQWTCHQCSAAKEAKVRPGGWQEHPEGQFWCERCWNQSFMLRAVTVAVAGLIGWEWPEVREVVRRCWDNATELANWYIRELARRDVSRTRSMEKLPPFKAPYLYNEAVAAFPEMDPTTVASMIRSIERTYREQRYETIWMQTRSLATFTWPQPYPFHNATWSVSVGEGGELLLSLRVGRERRTLRLAGGPGFRRQRVAIMKLIDGSAKQGEAAIMPAPVHASAHRPGVPMKLRGGGRAWDGRLMVKLVLWLPKPKNREKDGTLYVRTCAENFWTCTVDDDKEPRFFHADHLKRLAEAIKAQIWRYTNRKDRLADDKKLSRRQRRIRRDQNDAGAAWAKKQNDRVATFVHQATAMLVDYARRRRVAKVVFDHRDHSYFESFPWFQFVEKLRYKLDEYNIELEVIEPKDKKDDAA